MVPKILRFPESLRVSMMVHLILKMLATMTAARMERPEAVHVWCSTRLHWPSVTWLIRQLCSPGVACLHRVHSFVRSVSIPILLHRLFGTCHRA